jgi:hypothetical protein
MFVDSAESLFSEAEGSKEKEVKRRLFKLRKSTNVQETTPSQKTSVPPHLVSILSPHSLNAKLSQQSLSGCSRDCHFDSPPWPPPFFDPHAG